MRVIYLDNNATTRVHAEVFEAMRPYLSTEYGNPSTTWHAPGRRSRQAVERAREQVAALLHCSPDEIFFTSGGSEANTHVVLGVCSRGAVDRIVTSPIEHDSVRRAMLYSSLQDVITGTVDVDTGGRVRLDTLAASLEIPATLISVMWVNNETGVIQPIEEVVELARASGALVHSDAAQAIGRIGVDLSAVDLDFMTISSHKIHGPKGVGALFMRRGLRLEPRIFGGRQERGLRAGTENVAGIVGFGVACDLLRQRSQTVLCRMRQLREGLEEGLSGRCPGAVVFGDRDRRVANTLMIGWQGLEAADLLRAFDRVGICAASGSACTSEDPEPSHVLAAMGVAPELARGAIRFSLSAETTEEEIETVLEIAPNLVDDLRRRKLIGR